VQQQRVRGKKQPKIEVLDKEMFDTPQEENRAPNWELYLDGKPLDTELLSTCQNFKLEVYLEMLVSSKGILLGASSERIELTVKALYSLGLWMPFQVKVGSLSAEFDCDSRTLSLTGQVWREQPETPETPVQKLTPVELSTHDLLYDVV